MKASGGAFDVDMRGAATAVQIGATGSDAALDIGAEALLDDEGAIPGLDANGG